MLGSGQAKGRSRFGADRGIPPVVQTASLTYMASRVVLVRRSGSDVETGGVWDPLGLSKDESSLYRSRIIELKHGRVAMLAILGTLTQSFIHLPDPVFSNPRPLAALAQIYADRPVAFWQIFLTLGAIELTYVRPARSPHACVLS